MEGGGREGGRDGGKEGRKEGSKEGRKQGPQQRSFACVFPVGVGDCFYRLELTIAAVASKTPDIFLLVDLPGSFAKAVAS